MADSEAIAWIHSLDQHEADGILGEIYQRVLDPATGRLDNIMRVHSLNPAGLKAHFGLYRAVMAATPGLRGGDREMIALVVSRINDCHY